MIKIKRMLKNPIRTYLDSIKNSIIPKPYSHQITITYPRPKGQGI